MPHEFNTPPEFPEPGKDVGNLGHSQVGNARIEAQLNQPADVSQAHQFFQPKVDGLPNITLGDGGSSLASIPNGIMPGGEHAMAMPMMGDKAAMLTGITPGAEQGVSPLIQMIMKMPGLTGFMSDFFDFLKSLFEGDILSDLTAALMDPTGLMLHLFQEAGDEMSIGVDMLKNNASMFTFKNGMFMPGDHTSMNLHSDLLGGKDAANVGAPIQDVDPQQAIFEKTSNYTISEHHQQSLLDWHGANDQLAMGPGDGVYRPSMGGTYQPPAASTNATAGSAGTTTHPTTHHSAPVKHHAAAHHAPKHFKPADVSTDRTEIAQAPSGDAPGTGEYTVQSGDNLWDIARHNLGDGSRWGEIYRLNSDVIGQNPDLIHPGTTLRMPDANTVAGGAAEGSKYIVQSGDNLWNIAKDHMGGGENWGEIYRMNEGVIGSNPGLIHPGQELTLGGGGASVANAGGGAVAPAASVPTHSAAMSGAQASQGAQVSDTVAVSNAQQHMGALKAEAPVMAPTETTINSGTQVPTGEAAGGNQMYTAQDGSLFYRNKPQ